jgi:hypothetical protein
MSIASIRRKTFGNAEVFGVEVEYEEPEGEFVDRLARLSYLLLGQKLGSTEFYEVEDIGAAMKWVRGDCGRRTGGPLCSCTADDAFRWIVSILSDEVSAAPHASRFPVDVARFNLSFHPTHGSGWLILIACSGEGRILYRKSMDADLVVAVAPISTIEEALVEAHSFLESLVSH